MPNSFRGRSGSSSWVAKAELPPGRKAFQASQGLAMDFATRLKWVRPGVRFAEARAGVYSEVLESDPARTCLVLIDTASYARKSILLARRARELRLPTVIVCGTEDVKIGNARYAWYGIGPHSGFPGSAAVRNADSWAFFCADCAGVLLEAERNKALTIV